MEGKLTQTTPAHILAASPSIWKDLVKKLRVCRIEASSYEETVETFTNNAADRTNQVLHLQEPAYLLPLHEIEVEIGNKVVEMGVIDLGSQIIIIWEDLAQQVGATINANCLLEMEGANGATNWTLGCAEYLPMCIGDISFMVHAHVMKCAPFRLLLG